MSDIFDRESLKRLRAIYISHAKSASSSQIFVYFPQIYSVCAIESLF